MPEPAACGDPNADNTVARRPWDPLHDEHGPHCEQHEISDQQDDGLP